MRRVRVPRLLPTVVGIFALGLTACAPSQLAAPTTTAATTTTTMAEAEHTEDVTVSAEGAIDVAVTVTEFSVGMSRTEFQAGTPYRFVVSNEGVIPHELMLIPPGAGAATDMEAVHEVTVGSISEDDLPPGGTAEMIIIFAEPGTGSLEAACTLPGHYAAGMILPLTILA